MNVLLLDDDARMGSRFGRDIPGFQFVDCCGTSQILAYAAARHPGLIESLRHLEVDFALVDCGCLDTRAEEAVAEHCPCDTELDPWPFNAICVALNELGIPYLRMSGDSKMFGWAINNCPQAAGRGLLSKDDIPNAVAERIQRVIAKG